MSTEAQRTGIRLEIVTTTFAAAGVPEGIHDLSRLLENLNNPSMSAEIRLASATLRPLYRADGPLSMDAALLVKRDDIVFANFDGPDFARAIVRTATEEAPALLMAPPFQIQGTIAVGAGADPAEALRTFARGFFVVRGACVYDADGAVLGEGEQVIVNSAAVQMMSPTRRHIEASMPRNERGTTMLRRAAQAVVEPEEAAEQPAAEQPAARAA